ncbi:MAG: hypothetical protein ACXACO_17550 [Promethearchaeota archaeon]|jgi:hypothetical protein
MSAIPSLTLWVLALIFLIIGLGAMIILVVYTRYGREKSVRLSVVSIIIASTFLGFSVHFFLLNFGI